MRAADELWARRFGRRVFRETPETFPGVRNNDTFRLRFENAAIFVDPERVNNIFDLCASREKLISKTVVAIVKFIYSLLNESNVF